MDVNGDQKEDLHNKGPEKHLRTFSETQLTLLERVHQLSFKNLIEKVGLRQVFDIMPKSQKFNLTIILFYGFRFCRPS